VNTINNAIDAVGAALERFGNVAVAVSGGIDSVTLATIAARHAGVRAQMFHAVSPAVPPEATARLRELAALQEWRLHIIDAAEFEQAEYVANPVNRCFYCKQSLYSTIAQATSIQIVSGTNIDDLAEYRPGLDAARAAGVHHPFVDAGVGKSMIRAMARTLGLGALSELPASPCLSSRVETGIRVVPELVATIHRAEQAVREHTGAAVVRCRYRAAGVVIEMSEEILAGLGSRVREDVAIIVGAIFGSSTFAAPVSFAPYRTGSAFLVHSHV